MKILREKLRYVGFEPKNDLFPPFSEYYEFALKFQNRQFFPVLSGCQQVQFQKNLKNKLRYKIKILISFLKIPYLPYFQHDKNFSKQMRSVTFMYLLNPDLMQKTTKRLRANPEKKKLLLTDGWTDGQTDGQS